MVATPTNGFCTQHRSETDLIGYTLALDQATRIASRRRSGRRLRVEAGFGRSWTRKNRTQ